MGWEERLQTATYTSPSGQVLTFDYENVSQASQKKTTGFTFPDKDGAFVQDLGRGSRRFPLRVILWGDDCDLRANEFMAALEERGVGRLSHPLYGVRDVVPFGSISRRDDLKTAANQAILEVDFWETITDITFPNALQEANTQVELEVQDFVDVAPPQFEEQVSLVTSSEIVDFGGKVEATVRTIEGVLGPIAQATQAVKSQFDAIATSISANIDTLVGDPIILAAQGIELTRISARAASSISAKLAAYESLVTVLISNSFEASYDDQPKNAFLNANLFAESAIISAVETSINSTFETKPEALAFADSLIALFDAVNTWADNNRTALGIIDTGDSYQPLQAAVSLASGRLVEISFDLKQERIIQLDRARTALDFAAEFYGETDSILDFVITSNELTGDEILELPQGRSMRYYV